MGVIITPLKDITAYFDNNAISQSRLKTLKNGLDSFLKDQNKSESELYYSEKSHFITGSAVDIKLSGNDDDFNNTYHVAQIETKPSDVEMSIIHRVVDSIFESGIEKTDIQDLIYYAGFLTSAIQEEGWYKGNPGEKRIAGLIERCTGYFDELVLSHGKQIISKSEMQLIDSVVMSFKSNSVTSKYFDRETFERAEYVDIYYQLPIYFDYEGYPAKALLDILIVYKDDANNITSVQPVDIKTMSGNTLYFPNQLKSFRYDIQAAWYTLAISKWLEDQNTIEEPVILNFKFIVESTTQAGTPLEFNIDDEILEIGKIGRPNLYIGAVANLPNTGLEFASDDNFDDPEKIDLETVYSFKYQEVKGYKQLFEEYEWYQENGTSQDIRVAQSEGVFKINWNGIM